jgi:hypothetical protein
MICFSFKLALTDGTFEWDGVSPIKIFVTPCDRHFQTDIFTWDTQVENRCVWFMCMIYRNRLMGSINRQCLICPLDWWLFTFDQSVYLVWAKKKKNSRCDVCLTTPYQLRMLFSFECNRRTQYGIWNIFPAFISVGLDLTDQLLIRYSAFVRYWRKNGSIETVHQLVIGFKKAYDSVRREVLYSILIELGYPWD